jgi:hypothetical protein
MTTPLNPFPDYAVTRLVGGQATETTVVTAPIVRGRQLVDGYLKGLTARVGTARTIAALCAVRGDYGTGKTHLLNDVASYLRQHPDCNEAPSIVRATCIEADPLSWYRTQLGPQLDKLPLYDVTLRLYGQAAKTVASAMRATTGAVEILNKDPTQIRDLVRRNLISVDEVCREFDKLLGTVCKGADPTVRRVLSRLISPETDGPAREWIRGQTLTKDKAELLGVPTSIESAEQASAVIGAIASMHNALRRSFVMLVDELEHFVRYDVAKRAGNVTWLKRLLEQLGNAGALAIVAGHWSSWKTAEDYLDRFPQHAPIDLLKLEWTDVLDVVRARVPNLAPTFGETQARVIAQLSTGNMRRIMSLCNLLFRRSEGFQQPLSELQIRDAWTSVAQRLSQEQVSEEIATLLVSHGFAVKTADASFEDIPFDLVAERNDGRVLLVQANHSTTQGDHYDAAQKFIGKLAKFGNRAQRILGLFLADGSIDDELLRILRGSSLSNLRWFDLTERNVMDQIRASVMDIADQSVDLQAHADQVSASAQAMRQAFAEESARLRSMNEELLQRLQTLEEERYRQAQELQMRFDKLNLEADSSRTRSLHDQLNPERRVHASYEAMIQRPSVDTKLRYVGGALLFGIASFALGVFLIFERQLLSLWITGGIYMSFVVVLLGCLSAIAGCWLIWRRYSDVSEYFEFTRQLIHDLYVRDLPIDELLKVNGVLRQTIQRYDPSIAHHVALQNLLREKGLHPLVQDQVHKIMH